MQTHPLARLGWRAELQTDLDALGDPSLVAARVTAVDRGSVLVDAGAGAWRAPLAGRLRRASAMPATGDFVAALPGGPVRAVLPRRGVIARRVDGGRPQVLAANVDLALLATSLNRDLNPRRLVRFLAITARGGVDAVVLLTKADLAERRRRDRGPRRARPRRDPRARAQRRHRQRPRGGASAARAGAHGGAARQLGRRQVDAAQRPAGRGAPGHAADPRRRRPRPPRDRAPRAGGAAGRRAARRHARPAQRRAARRRRRARAAARQGGGQARAPRPRARVPPRDLPRHARAPARPRAARRPARG